MGGERQGTSEWIHKWKKRWHVIEASMVKASGYGKIKNVGFKNQGRASASHTDHCNSVLLQLSHTCLSVVLNFPLHAVLPQPLDKSNMNIKANASQKLGEMCPSIRWVLAFAKEPPWRTHFQFHGADMIRCVLRTLTIASRSASTLLKHPHSYPLRAALTFGNPGSSST